MAFLRQTWTLTQKTLLIVVKRHWFATIIRAIILPIVFEFFISYAQNLFVPPSDFGIGAARPLRDLTAALGAADPSRNTVAFVNGGHTAGQIERVINQVATTARDAGKDVRILSSSDDLLTVCPSTLRGTTPCYGAVTFRCSPTEGSCGVWNYTLAGDGYFGTKIYVHDNDNDAELYTLPFQRAIDEAIVGLNGSTNLPQTLMTYPYTSETQQGRDDEIRHLFMNALINFLGVAFFVGIVGVVYHLTGQMASERELGLSQLIEAMTPNAHVWHTQAARLISNHLAFDLVYLPSWLVMAGILKVLVFTKTSAGIIIVFHLLIGLALSSWSVIGASFFRKSQLSGITVTMVSVVLAIIAQVQTPNSSGAIAITTLLFPPMGYVYFIHLMARWEYQSLPTNLVKGAPNSPWQLPGIAIWVLLIVAIIAYPILAGFVERWLHGTGSKARKLNFHPEDPSKALQLSSFSKEYKPGWWARLNIPWLGKHAKQTVHAVNNLSLTALQGQIFVLLGANGSGKSTTLDAISGLTEMSGGAIEIDGTGGLGLCPQRNVMWDELTVFEHIQIFNKLKSAAGPDDRAVLEDLVLACDLQLKRSALAKTLSGGQKRKLQLAMMFTGGSRVCCIDEVSSGLDPLSRRKIWDILLRERGQRTLLLTTHYLDEPEALADHIAILSRGNLMAEGSAVELKQRFGGGYKIHIGHSKAQASSDTADNSPVDVYAKEKVYNKSDSAEAAIFLSELDEQQLNDYQVVGPTIEDVFLKLAEEVKDELHEPAPVVVPVHASSGSKKSEDSEDGDKPGEDTDEKVLRLHDGRGTGLFRQSWILFRKRLTIVRRTNWPYLFAFLIPVITAGLVTFFVQDFDGLSCTPGAQVHYTAARGLNVDLEVLIPYGPPSLASVAELATLAHQNRSEFRQVSSLDEFNRFVDRRYANVTPGGFFVDGTTPTLAYQGDAIMAFPFIMQSFVNQIMSRIPIVAQYQSFAWPWAPQAGDTLQLILYFGLAMSVFPALFALYPTVERLRNVRALHYSNGIRASPLWAAYTFFDFLWVLLISVLVTVIFAAVSDVWYHIEYLFVVFFLYGLSAILVAYCVSLFVSSSLAAFAFAAGGQAVFFLIYFVTFMCIVTYTPATQIDENIFKAQWALGLFFPSGNLLRSLLLTLNEFSVLCRGDRPASYPGDWNVYGSPIFYLLVQSIALFTFLVWWDSGYKPSFLIRARKHDEEEEESGSLDDPDVVAEVTRVRHSDDPLRVMHLTKTFGKNTAVDDVSFGVPRGETFALLGPNGAGKSTTISLIRGDTRPSHRGAHRGGDILVGSTSILGDRAAARSHLGVCPQFDSPDLMTVEEHLRFYARARGVADVDHNVRAIVAAVGLEAFATRMAGALSGGNKRKLSLGIALMGNPSVLLLDEPSSGMDAASKRVMWRTLGAISEGRSLVITTHSMEEADALADKAGIMAGRMLAFGSSEQLRRRYGNAFQVHVVLKGAPHVDDTEAERVKAWVENNIEGAVTDEKIFHGQLRFSVPHDARMSRHTDAENPKAQREQSGIAQLFALLEKNKEALGFEYYSVGQTTLDQVFLTIVGKHNIEEEGHRDEVAPKKDSIFKRAKKMLPKR